MTYDVPIYEPSAATVAAALQRVTVAGVQRKRARRARAATASLLLVVGLAAGIVAVGRGSDTADVRTTQPDRPATTAGTTATTQAPGVTVADLGMLPAGWTQVGPVGRTQIGDVTTTDVTVRRAGGPSARFSLYDEGAFDSVEAVVRFASPTLDPAVVPAGSGALVPLDASGGVDDLWAVRLPNGRLGQLSTTGLDRAEVVALVAGLDR